ncbi:MAG: TlpA family protein disulfide reductase [Maribacter sp.]
MANSIESFMKLKYIVFALCFLFLLACKETPKVVEQQEASVMAEPEQNEPKSTFEDLVGNPIELSDYKGKRVLLNFWATWCRPCIEEMPALLKAEAVLKDENYVFLLASDQSEEKIVAFKEKKGFDFKYLKFHGAMSDFDISALPATFIYNEEGKMVHRIDGATEWDSPSVIDDLKAIQ